MNIPKLVFANATTLAGGSVWIFLFKEAPRFNAAKLFNLPVKRLRPRADTVTAGRAPFRGA